MNSILPRFSARLKKADALRRLFVVLSLLAGLNLTKAGDILDQRQLLHGGGFEYDPETVVWQCFTPGIFARQRFPNWPLGDVTNVVAIAAGDYHSVALVAEAPALAVQNGGENISVWWPAWAEKFGLQFTTNLQDANSWTVPPRPPATIGSFKQATDSMSGQPIFYRLQK